MREEIKEAKSAPGTAVPWEVVQLGGAQNCEWKQEGWGVLSMHTSGTGEGLQGRVKQFPWANIGKGSVVTWHQGNLLETERMNPLICSHGSTGSTLYLAFTIGQ